MRLAYYHLDCKSLQNSDSQTMKIAQRAIFYILRIGENKHRNPSAPSA